MSISFPAPEWPDEIPPLSFTIFGRQAGNTQLASQPDTLSILAVAVHRSRWHFSGKKEGNKVEQNTI